MLHLLGSAHSSTVKSVRSLQVAASHFGVQQCPNRRRLGCEKLAASSDLLLGRTLVLRVQVAIHFGYY